MQMKCSPLNVSLHFFKCQFVSFVSHSTYCILYKDEKALVSSSKMKNLLHVLARTRSFIEGSEKPSYLSFLLVLPVWLLLSTMCTCI